MATVISWQQPGLKALSETDGHGDSCGPIVILDYRAVAHPAAKGAGYVPLDIITLDTERAELIRWGLMNAPGEAGMTISQIATALSAHYGLTPVKVVPYSANLDWNTFHADLIGALAVKHQLVLYETANASALPDNQPGVQYHFVLVGGIHSALGYLMCNGDTETALRAGGVVDPVWVGVGAIAASQPCGYIILPSLDPPAAPPPPPAPPIDWQARFNALRAKIAADLTTA